MLDDLRPRLQTVQRSSPPMRFRPVACFVERGRCVWRQRRAGSMKCPLDKLKVPASLVGGDMASTAYGSLRGYGNKDKEGGSCSLNSKLIAGRIVSSLTMSEISPIELKLVCKFVTSASTKSSKHLLNIEWMALLDICLAPSDETL